MLPLSPRRQLKRIFLAIAASLALCVGISYLGLLLVAHALGNVNLGDDTCNVSNPASVESIGNFRFPPSTKLLSTYCGGMQGWGVWASFEMNPNDLTIFLATTGVKQPLSNSKRPEKLRCACQNNEKITDYLYGEYTSHNNNHSWQEEVFIDTHDKNLYTVYFTVLGG